MRDVTPREVLAQLIAQKGENFGSLSRLLGRNPAYIQQFIRRGTPRKLDEDDRRTLARYFGVDEAMLGGPAAAAVAARTQARTVSPPGGAASAIVPVFRFPLEASAGAGSLTEDERAVDVFGFPERWIRSHGWQPENLSIIDVKGESMAPTLNEGDRILVHRMADDARLQDGGIYVLRLDDVLMVKRIALSPRKGARALTISSDNPLHPTWHDVDPALVDIVGRVVWRSSLLR